MRITVDQTESSVLGLGGIPVGLGESLQSGKILRDALNTVLRVRFVFVVAVLNSPLGVLLVIKFSRSMANNRSGNNILPLLNVTVGGNLVELETLLDLKGVLSHLIEESGGRSLVSTDELGAIEMEILLAGIKTTGIVVDVLRGLIPEELLVLVINDELLKTTALILTVKDERGGLVLRFHVMEVEAVVGLHSGELGLSASSGPGEGIGDSVTVLNVDIEVDIRVKRNGLTSERRLSEGITPSVVSRASKSSLRSLLELRDGEIPTLEYFTSAKVENFAEALTLSGGVRNESVVHQSGFPGNSSPVTGSAVITRSFLADINTNSRKILRRRVVLIVFTIGTINIRSST